MGLLQPLALVSQKPPLLMILLLWPLGMLVAPSLALQPLASATSTSLLLPLPTQPAGENEWAEAKGQKSNQIWLSLSQLQSESPKKSKTEQEVSNSIQMTTGIKSDLSLTLENTFLRCRLMPVRSRVRNLKQLGCDM